VQRRRRYTWNEEKRASNLLNHKIDFAIAHDFEWETALEFQDRRRDYGERRMVAYGEIASRLHVMVWTPRHGTVRLISLRKANGREIDRYEISQR
jgi:hypothetical protein